MNKKNLSFLLCITVAMIAGLTAHIVISAWTTPLTASLMQGFSPDSSLVLKNDFLVIVAAYGTAFIPVGCVVFLYYHTQHLLKIESKFLKALVVACLILGIKGDLLRQPFMNFLVNYVWGMKAPFLFSVLTQLDKWVSNLLLVLCVVYLCPAKKDSATLRSWPLNEANSSVEA